MDRNNAVDIANTCFINVFGFYNRTGFIRFIVRRRSIGIEALATLGKGDVTSLHRSRRRSQTLSNGYAAFKVAVACHVPQLVCQGVQHFTDIVFICSSITFSQAFSNTIVTGVKHHLGAGLGSKNFNIAADNSARSSISVLIPDLGNAFSLSDLNRIIVLHADDTSRCAVFSPDKAAKMRHSIVTAIARLTVFRHMLVVKAVFAGRIFIDPLCTILEPQIDFSRMIRIHRRYCRIILRMIITIFFCRTCLCQIGIID